MAAVSGVRCADVLIAPSSPALHRTPERAAKVLASSFIAHSLSLCGLTKANTHAEIGPKNNLACIRPLLVRSKWLPPPLAGQSTSHLRDDQIPSPSDLWYWPPIRLSRNNPYRTKLRFFSVMARRLQNCLRQSSIYAVSLANSGDKKSDCTYH